MKQSKGPKPESEPSGTGVGSPKPTGKSAPRCDSGHHRCNQTRPPPVSSASDLDALTALSAAALIRSGTARPPNVIVTNCGCRTDERSAQPHHNLKRKDQ